MTQTACRGQVKQTFRNESEFTGDARLYRATPRGMMGWAIYFEKGFVLIGSPFLLHIGGFTMPAAKMPPPLMIQAYSTPVFVVAM